MAKKQLVRGRWKNATTLANAVHNPFGLYLKSRCMSLEVLFNTVKPRLKLTVLKEKSPNK